MHKVGFLPDDVYREVFSFVPIVCVDIVVIHEGKFLLCKRTNKPGQRKLFLPGGRIFKNESLIEAAARKTKEELGIKAKKSDFEFLTVTEGMFRDSRLGGSMHNINVTFLLKTRSEPKIDFDQSQTSDIKWLSRIDSSWHHSVKLALKKAGFK